MNRHREADYAEKLRRIQMVTDAALASLDLDDLLTELLDRTRELLDVDTAAIMLLDPTGRQLIATAASGLEEEVQQGIQVPVGRGFSGKIAATGQPLTIDHVDRDTVYSEVLIEKHLAAMTGVPLMAAGRLIGVLHIGSVTGRKFTDDDADLLRLVADRAALAAQAQLTKLDRATTLALQRSLLPAYPPAVSGLQFAARYIPGAQVGVGGDWYDLFELPSGHVGVVIGDVAGNGLRAAVVMGRIRSALRAYALESVDPADVLYRLDRKIQRFEPDAMATALYGVIDPTRTHLTMSSAGHLPPILVTNPGSDVVRIPPDPPLGAHIETSRRNTIIELPVDAGLLLYTDGLIERRDQPLTDSIARLTTSLQAGDAEHLCARAIAHLGNDIATDDVAVVVVRRLALTE